MPSMVLVETRGCRSKIAIRRRKHAHLGQMLAVLGLVFLCGEARELQATPQHVSFLPKPTQAETYGESYSIISELEDRTFLLFQLLFTNAGIGDRKAACRLMHRPATTGLEQYGRRYDETEWQYIARENLLQVGDCSLSGNAQETRFRIQLDGIEATLRMMAPARTVRPVPTVKGEWGFYAQEILTPWARVEVTLKKAQQRPQTLAGWGYFDHTRSEALLPKVASNWVRFRGFYDGVPLVLQIRFAPNGELGDAWLWRQGEPHVEQIIRAKRLPATALPQWELQTAKHTWRIETGERIFLYEPAKSYGLLGRLARPLIGNPMNHTYRATMRSESLGMVRGTVEWAQIER